MIRIVPIDLYSSVIFMNYLAVIETNIEINVGELYVYLNETSNKHIYKSVVPILSKTLYGKVLFVIKNDVWH